MSCPLTYWHSGGDLLCAGRTTADLADAQALLALYDDEARAAANAGDARTRATALQFAAELSEAIRAAKRWRRAAAYTVDG